MKKLIFSLLMFSTGIIIYCNSGFAQVDRQWLSIFNGPSNAADEPNAMVTDTYGNIYITGLTKTPGALSPSEFVTVKYNPYGVLIWAEYYNGSASADSSRDVAKSIAIDNTGNVYVTGSSYGGVSNYDYVTIKYNSGGVQKWVIRYNSTVNGNDEAVGIASDNSGNVYVTGYSPGSGSATEFKTIKYDSSGNQIWIKGFISSGDNYSIPVSVRTDVSGNVYVTGSSNQTGFGDNYATVKYNSAGVQLWAATYSGVSSFQDNAYSVAVDNSGNVYVTGASWGTGTNLDYSTIKYNSSGAQQWVKRYNGSGNSTDLANSIEVDSTGNVYVTGFSLGAGTSYDFATIKYNSSGDSIWVRRYDYGPGGNRDDRAFDLALDRKGNTYVTGWSSSTTFNDYAIIKYNSSGTMQWVERYNGVSNYDDSPVSIVVDNSENIFVTGKSWSDTNNYDFTTIKYSPVKILQLQALIEGFYDQITSTMVQDTIRIYLRNVSPPYAITDSSKNILNTAGAGTFQFFNPLNGTPYFIVIKHRNSIETWSSGGNSFTSDLLTYDFTPGPFQAYGNNLKLKGLRYCIFSGDVNQDGSVDATDFISIYNEASVFMTGYVQSDVNGDYIADISDVIIAYNNSSTFVTIIRP